MGLVAILLLTIPAMDLSVPPPNMYGIVFDAGSSHTSMYIYKWPADKQNGTGVVSQHSECHPKGKGISSYSDQPGAAGQSLDNCLKMATKEIPAARHRLTPVYLGATAGMRLLNQSNHVNSTRVLKEVGEKIKGFPFDFKGAAILSGQEEGAYGWVTVNYLLENFIKYGFIGHWMTSGRATVGALDFGGASTQITFVTHDGLQDPKDSMKLRLYGQNYTLYTHSFLCYGRDQMLLKLLAQVLKSQAYPHKASHPCYPKDFTTTITLEEIYNSPCTSHLKPTPYSQGAHVTLQGTGQYTACLQNMEEIFDFKICSFSQCSFNEVFQPNVTGNFMAFSAFFYVHSFLERVTKVSVRSPDQLKKATTTLCNMTSSEMSIIAPDQKSRLHDYCAASVFVDLLLTKGYGFNEDSFPKISFQKKAGDASVGWALGYMLILSNLVPAEGYSLRKALPAGTWICLIVLCTLLLVMALLALARQILQQRNSVSKRTAAEP